MQLREFLEGETAKRILVLDGAMGTMVQTYGLGEEDFRGERFKDHGLLIKGNNDVLCLTQPKIVEEIHKSFLDAGADFVSTNTFNGTSISQADYEMEGICYEINKAGAEIARRAVDVKTEETPDRPRFVLGSLGPMNKTLSLSPDVNDPGFRAVTFDEVKASYKEAAEGLLDGGAHGLLVETVFDTLNCKAALFAIDEIRVERGIDIPVFVSGTITDLSGRTLSGQTVEAFWHSVRHGEPVCVGLNCSMGAEQLRPFQGAISRVADTLVCGYPNAGLPNEFGEYDETPEIMAAQMKDWAEVGYLNIVGGCCGTTPDHIRAIAEAVEAVTPRAIPNSDSDMRLSGLEPLAVAS